MKVFGRSGVIATLTIQGMLSRRFSCQIERHLSHGRDPIGVSF